jgi:tetratricopeptide (TPR) repeat protein
MAGSFDSGATTMPDHADLAKSIFLAALDSHRPEQWPAFLDEACAGDAPLRARVERLLSAQARLGSFHEDSPPARVATVDVSPVQQPGTIIGPYKLLQQIGEGGMGTVFLAEQTQPVQRKVALKFIKVGLDSKQVIARFEAERQALALMEHPNIAKVLDAGTTDGRPLAPREEPPLAEREGYTGRPYFVMELVKGVSITKYCDERRLTPKERLELFIPVCQAVQHAHQKGVIHRDLKPSNVLIALYDGKPVPKVIDFGVAKATGPKLTDRTLFTEFGALVGTLEYMSPEQAELNQLDVDTRSDIYALGVLLYELLTGTTPLGQNRVKEAGLLEALRIIREEETPRPSARLSTAAELPVIAANRGLEPKKLSGLMRGELDWIVMKALEKDRNRRYESASSLAQDIERYLHDEPVQACPPSLVYRLRKFARRNRRPLTIAVLVLLMLLAAAGSFGWNMRDRAFRDAAIEQEANLALQQAEDFSMQGNWFEARSAIHRAQAVLASGASNSVIQQRAERLLADLRLLTTLENLGLYLADERSAASNMIDTMYARAFQEFDINIEVLEANEAAELILSRSAPHRLAAALEHWAIVRKLFLKMPEPSWKHLLAVARAVDMDVQRNRVRELIERGDQKELIQLARADNVGALPASTLSLLGNILFLSGEAKEGAILLRKAQERYPNDFWINLDLAASLVQKQPHDLDEALRFATAAVALRPQSPLAHLDLGAILRRKGRHEDAIAAYQQAVYLCPGFALAHNNLGNALKDKELLDRAIAEYRQAISLEPGSAMFLVNLGDALFKKGCLDESIRATRKAIELDPRDVQAHVNLGIQLDRKGDTDGSIMAFRQVIKLDPRRAPAHNDLAIRLKAKGDLEGAIRHYRLAIQLAPAEALPHRNLALTWMAKGDNEEAIAEYRRAIKLDPTEVDSYLGLGAALNAKGDLPGAIAEYRRALGLNLKDARLHYNLANALRANRDSEGAIAQYRQAINLNPKYVRAHNNLGIMLETNGDLPGAIAEYRQAISLDRKHAKAHCNLGHALHAQGDVDGAIGPYKESIRLRPDDGETHCFLGLALRDRGLLAEALTHLKRGHELSSRQPGWRHPSLQWIRDCERLIELERAPSKK